MLKNKKNYLTPLHISKKRAQLSFIDDNAKEKNKESEENKEKKNNTPLNKNLKSFFISQQGTPLNNELNNEMEKKLLMIKIFYQRKNIK